MNFLILKESKLFSRNNLIEKRLDLLSNDLGDYIVNKITTRDRSVIFNRGAIKFFRNESQEGGNK